MLELFRAENIFDVARPLHQFSRVFGLTAFAIDENEGRSWKARVTVLNIILVLLLSAYLLTLSVFFVINFDELMNMEGIFVTNVIRIATILVTEVFIFTVMMISITTIITRHSIVKIFNIIAEFDRELFNLGVEQNHKKHKILVFTLMTGWTLLTSFALIGSVALHNLHGGFSMNIILFLSLAACINFIFAFEFQFILVLWSIKVRFREVNRFLCKSFNSNSANCDDYLKIKNLIMAARLHEMLVNATEAVSEGFGVAVSF